jgi:integrase
MGPIRIDRITTEDVEEARAKHLEGHAPATANHWLRNLKLLFHWAVARKLIPEMPWAVRMMKVQKRPRVILPIAKAAEWLKAIDDAAGESEGVKVAVRLMLGLGLREMEALGARWAWVDFERKTYTPGITKGREAEPVPMPGWLVNFLSALNPDRKAAGYIVVAPKGGFYASGYTRVAFRAANRAVGVPGLTPHRLRGTFATLLSEAGVPVQDIQKVMRHKDLKTTLGYLEKDHTRAVRAQEEIARKMGFETLTTT